MKVCTKCLVGKELKEFSKDSRHKTGLQTQCKGCVNEASRERYRKNMQDPVKREAHNQKSLKSVLKAYHRDMQDPVRREVVVKTRREVRRRLMSDPSKHEALKKSALDSYYKTMQDPVKKEARGSGQRKWRLWQEYGLTPAWYEDKLEEQGGGCAICHARAPGGGCKYFHVDHKHVDNWSDLKPEERTRHARGLLCGSCNRGIGLLKDSPETLRGAAAYIERY